MCKLFLLTKIFLNVKIKKISERGWSMKKFISVVLSIALLLSTVALAVSAADDGVMSFAVASDLHYVEPTEPVEHNNDDPIYYYANRRAQMEHESGFIIDEFLRQCAEDENCEFVNNKTAQIY